MQKIFISSTFRDMQAERDAIHTTVVPELRRIAQKYGEDVEFSDLRWGVNTGDLDSEEGAEKVLSVCLDEIDKCKPFMIIILGERYGWIPKPELLQSVAERKNYQLEELEKSVTALEIEYGALNNPEVLERSIFLFREPILGANEDYQSEGEEYAKRLNALKNRIRKLAGERLFYYQLGWDKEKGVPTQIEHFTTIVIKQLQILLEQEWQKNAKLSENQKEEKRHWEFVDMKAKKFRGRNKLLEECKQILENPKGMLLIEGEVGSGKSTLWSKLVLDYRQHGWKVYPFVCGQSSHSVSVMDIIKQWTYYVEDLLRIEHFEEVAYKGKEKFVMSLQKKSVNKSQEDWKERLRDVLCMYGTKEELPPLLLAVDEVDKLSLDELAEQFFFLPVFKQKKIYYLLSCHKDFNKKNYKGDCILIGDMTREEQMEVLTGILSYQRKELNQAVIEEIIKKEGADNPLYLGLLIQRLVMMDKQDFDVIAEYGNDMAAITQYQVELVKQAPQHLEEMSKLLIQETGKRVNSELVQRMAEYLAVSRQGLRECDLQVLLEKEGIQWNSLDFTHVLYYMPMLFVERKDAKIDLANRSVCSGLRKEIDEEQIERSIFEYLKELPMEDAFCRSEMVYYCYVLDEKEYFIKYLLEADEITKKNAAQELYRICIEDAGDWYAEVLEEIEDWECKGKMLSFVIYYFGNINEAKTKLELEVEFKIYSIIFEFAKSFYERAHTPVNAWFWSVCFERIGFLYEKQEKLEEAIPMYRNNLSIRRTLYEELKTEKSAEDYSVALKRIGNIYEQQKNYAEAVEKYETNRDVVWQLYEKTRTTESAREYAIACVNIGDIHKKQGNIREALKNYQEAESVFKEIYNGQKTAEDAGNYAVILQRLGDIYDIQGKSDEAIKKCDESQRILHEVYEKLASPESAMNYASNCARLGTMCKEQNNLREALFYYNESLRVSRQVYKEFDTIKNAKVYSAICKWMGDIYIRQGENQEALIKYKEGFFVSRKLWEKEKTLENHEDYIYLQTKSVRIMLMNVLQNTFVKMKQDIPNVCILDSLNEEQVANIQAYCAKDIKKEDILVYCSTDIMNPDGKQGYVFSFEGIYADDSMNHDRCHEKVLPVFYADIERCECKEECPDYIKCILLDGRIKYFYTDTYSQFFCDFINEIVSLFRR